MCSPFPLLVASLLLGARFPRTAALRSPPLKAALSPLQAGSSAVSSRPSLDTPPVLTRVRLLRSCRVCGWMFRSTSLLTGAPTPPSLPPSPRTSLVSCTHCTTRLPTARASPLASAATSHHIEPNTHTGRRVSQRPLLAEHTVGRMGTLTALPMQCSVLTCCWLPVVFPPKMSSPAQKCDLSREECKEELTVGYGDLCPACQELGADVKVMHHKARAAVGAAPAVGQ
jgi:hypothetical protein